MSDKIGRITFGESYDDKFHSMQVGKLEARIAELEATIETQQQYLDNKDSVIKGMNEMITKLEGDLEVMRLQRDATQSSRCPNCERLRAALQNIHDHAIDNGEDCAYLDARKALREDEDE